MLTDYSSVGGDGYTVTVPLRGSRPQVTESPLARGVYAEPMHVDQAAVPVVETAVETKTFSIEDATEAELAQWRQDVVFHHGEYFDSYLATEPGRSEFRSSTGEGLISYARRGRYLVVGGGLIGPDHHRPQLLAEFSTYLKKNKLTAAFHNIADYELPLFREHGYQITKWGEEPIVDLEGLDWKGKPFEWVRRQTNFCRRNGLEFSEVVPSKLDPDEWSSILSEMLEIAELSIAQKAQKQMKFFEGTIGEHEIGRRRVFVARSEEGRGRIEAFVVCTPMRGGEMWATELYRRRPDAVRGTIAFLFQQIFNQMKDEGVRCVGMCLDPALRCWDKLPGDSFLIRMGMTWGECCLGMVFDVIGIRHFKSRFRPRYESRYVCVTPKASIFSILAFMHVSGLFAVNPWKLIQISIDRFRKRGQRSTLADLH